MKARAIVIFARHPTPGRVKSRLAAGIGDHAAAHFYKHCAEWIIWQCTRVPNADVYVFYSASDEASQIASWIAPFGHGIRLREQRQSDALGHRMAAALEQTFSEGDYRCVTLVGTDVPKLATTHVERAFEALHTHDVAFGPAADGGYYLVAVRAGRLLRGLFDGIQWSTSVVLEQNIRAAQSLALKTASHDVLPVLADIDTADDLQDWLSTDTERGKGSATGGDEDEVDERYLELLHAAREALGWEKR